MPLITVYGINNAKPKDKPYKLYDTGGLFLIVPPAGGKWWLSSFFMVHHRGKGGDQRGTSAKQDILDTVIRLDRLRGYSSAQQTRFEAHLANSRGISGPEARPFEAQSSQANQRQGLFDLENQRY